MQTIIVELELERSTKGTHLYANRETDNPIQSIYIKKHGLPEVPPTKILLRIEESND